MLYLHHSNRSELLRDALAEVCVSAPAEPFVAETVVVQNPGMARWLALGLAERIGVAAHLEFPLLASFIWRVYAAQFDTLPEHSPLDRDIMLWRLMALLPAQLDDPAYAPLRHYLQGADEPLRRYQLAQRIADLFDQYLVFRAERVLAWEAGEEQHWQARLWRALCADRRPPHRARLYAEFAARARAGALRRADLPARVSLFGLTAIAPAYIDVLQALGDLIDVHLFVLNPSLAYWGDIASERDIARLRRLRAQHGADAVAAADHLHVGNPLLASLGKQGRDLIDLLHESAPVDHDRFAPPASAALLGVLQTDMLLLQSRGEGADEQPPLTLAPDDRSVQVHVAHSRMREVQVLHDRLLAEFERLPGLTPRDIVVMAPDIDAYAPYIEAVFGAAPPPRRMPWSIADRRSAAESPLAATFLTLLDLPQSRLTVSEVLALLENAAIMRRLGLEQSELERVRDWVREANIRWGLDAGMRGALGLPEDDAASWAFGLRRLLLGYAMPPDADTLCAGIAPYPDVEGGEARALGVLAGFIERLGEWRKRLASPRDAAGWERDCGALCDDFFAPDEDEARFLQLLRNTLAALRKHCVEAGFGEPIALAVLRDVLRGRLEAAGAGQAFLDGRVSFCNMVPMRSIPFRVVCLLGMNDGDYPRNQRPLSFDLMAEQPRRGDRSRREDDRYLFLEALLSARDVLYISYVGRDIRSNAARVPSVLLGELLEAIERGFRAADGGKVLAQIVTEHPLQPFSARCFGADARLASYAAEWLPDPEHRGLTDFFAAPLPEPDDAPWRDLELDTLAEFLRHPVRFLLERRLGVNLRESGAADEDAEPFALDHLARWQIKDRALNLTLADRDPAAFEPLVHASGSLPSAGFGHIAYVQAVAGVPELADKLREAGVETAGEGLELDLHLGETRLRGWLRDVRPGGLLLYRVGTLRPEDRLRLWLWHLALNALAPAGVRAQSVFCAEDAVLRLGPVADATTRLRDLIDLFREGCRMPLPLFPRSSFACADRLASGNDLEAALKAARAQWTGSRYRAGEADDPYLRLAFRDRDPLDEQFAALAERVYAPLFDACLEADA
ncbi:exodeoxyribonuclease V subunit gamma [Acidihalobacter ferrooxydans]|uniref:RecBCD enzyme subunit RecC n=1 Tax=Acidihalobacter ferrooxydans TaxID=1765967 RepID=A0A1P8UJK7_9GAMM|nr:exodeoxyribonuclease V subunit gamma [Acidihalobacter ferrooxydans]APZ44017.1 exodeoxyribonuclease V subunit gamma [Acidihalobacter ferrooxydans]